MFFNRSKPASPNQSDQSAPSEPATEGINGLTYIDQTSMIRMRLSASKLKLHSRKIYAQQSGYRLSSFRGRGMEFDESRIYQPGDDIRSMDWKVMARTGSAHTKIFREERERPVLLWVDYREPMFFATHGVFKSVIASRAAAALAWASNQQGDKLGGLIFSDYQHAEVRPKRGKTSVLHFIKKLHEAQHVKQNEEMLVDAEQALSRLRRVTRPGSLIFLISDFRALGEKAESHITQLSQHNDVVMLFIYDELEKTLPPDGQYLVQHGNSNLLFSSSELRRSEYQDLFKQRFDTLQRFAYKHRINLISCSTQQDPLTILQRSFG